MHVNFNYISVAHCVNFPSFIASPIVAVLLAHDSKGILVIANYGQMHAKHMHGVAITK